MHMKWTSVKKNLPANANDVIVTVEEKISDIEHKTCICIASYQGGNWFCWYKIPCEPYKEGI